MDGITGKLYHISILQHVTVPKSIRKCCRCSNILEMLLFTPFCGLLTQYPCFSLFLIKKKKKCNGLHSTVTSTAHKLDASFSMKCKVCKVH